MTAHPLVAKARWAVPGWLSRHWLFLALLSLGAVLRVLTMLAFRPALLYPDSVGYLATADRLRVDAYRPSGYAVLLAGLPYRHHLVVIPLVQHLAGLAVAALLYVVVLRLVGRPWVAALATAPLLLDALMLDLEQYVMSDDVFALELAVACVLLVVIRRPRVGTAAAVGVGAGLIFGLAAITRTVGAPVAVAAVPVVVAGWARPRLRDGLIGGACVLAGFAAVYGGYLTAFHHDYGTYSTSVWSGRFMYARVAPQVDCRHMTLPSYERPLCDTPVPRPRPGVPWYMWNRDSPAWQIQPPAGVSADHVYSDFARRAIRSQPLPYAASVVHAFGWSFLPLRIIRPGDDGLSEWEFQTDLPQRRLVKPIYAAYDPHGLQMDRGLVQLLGAYGRVAYAPGPLLALGLITPLLALGGAGRARTSGLRMPAGLFAAVGAAALISAFAGAAFDWRYTLPQLTLLPPAAAIGMTAIFGRTSGDVPDPALPDAHAAVGDAR